jgi:hypothetical protein
MNNNQDEKAVQDSTEDVTSQLSETSSDSMPVDGKPTTIPNVQDTDLTTGDWIVCVICSGIGCILGVIRLIQGKPNAGKMIGVSIASAGIWFLIRILIQAAN